MKKLLIIVSVSLINFCCSKEKTPTIMGEWMEVSRYVEELPGQFQWKSSTDGPIYLDLFEDGNYFATVGRCGVYGPYEYNANSRLLKLPGLSAPGPRMNYISYLTTDQMIMDFSENCDYGKRMKFVRIID